MKAILVIALMLSLSMIPGAFADYKAMTRAYDAYTPPGFSLEADLGIDQPESPMPGHPGLPDNRELETFISRLKTDRENQLRGLDIPFLAPVPADIMPELKQIAKDRDRLAARLKSGLVLRDLEIFTALRNPNILAAQKKVSAEIQSFNQVLDLETSLEQFSAFTEGLALKAGPLNMKGAVRLKHPFPGVGALKGQVVDHQVDILNQQRVIALKNAVTSARTEFWEYIHVRAAREITRETMAALERLKGIATALYEAGKTSFQDVIKINIRMAALSEDLVTLERREETIRIRILELMNMPQDFALGPPRTDAPDKPFPPPAELVALGLTHNQGLNILKATIQKTKKMIWIAESMVLPDYALNFALNEDEAINTTGTGAPKPAFPVKRMAAMKNGLPARPWYGIDDPWLRSIKEKLIGLKHRLAGAEKRTARKIQDAWFAMDKANRERLLYERRILDLSASALRVSTSEYESGAVPFSQAIGSYMDWLNIRLGISEKHTRFKISIAELERLTGKTL